MSDQTVSEAPPAAGWRLKLGVSIFVFSILVPVVGMPIVAVIDLSTSVRATVIGGLLMCGEGFGILAVVVMGKPSFQYIKSRVFAFLKEVGPPQRVSCIRYNIDLVMFCIPILFGWASVYAANYIPGFSQNSFSYAIGFDLLLLASLFVLGGDFWDKLHALFVSDAEVHFAQN